MERSIEVPAEWASIATLMAFADSVESSMPLNSEQGYIMRLVIEEIATNIVKYGYDERAPGPIFLRCQSADEALTVIIRDRGKPFDPRDPPDPNFNGDASERVIGGLGIFLVREFADEITYQRDEASGWNELVVVKRAGQA